MNHVISYLIGPLLCYLLGSIPVAFLLVKYIKGIDIRTIGSRNVGATNAARAFSKQRRVWVFVAVFAMDILKGLASVALIFSLLGHQEDSRVLPVTYGLLAIIGHIWPVYLNFRGGKGVATSAGVLLCVAPYAVLIATIAWLLTVILTKYISLASIVSAACLTLGYFGRHLIENSDPFGNVALATTCFCLLITVLVVAKHRSNIRRLVAGTEARIGHD